MEQAAFGLDSSWGMAPADPAPWAHEYVQLTKQAHGELVMQANYWKAQHGRAIVRSQWREDRYRRVNRQLKEQATQREAALRAQLDLANAKVRELQQRVFGRKSERHKGGSEQQARAPATRRRGQQPGSRGHARTMQTNLPERVEVIALDSPQCPRCGLELKPFPGTQDSEVVEIAVSAYRRVIRRRRYQATCGCGCVPGRRGCCGSTAPDRQRQVRRVGLDPRVAGQISLRSPQSPAAARLGRPGLEDGAGDVGRRSQNARSVVRA